MSESIGFEDREKKQSVNIISRSKKKAREGSDQLVYFFLSLHLSLSKNR